MKAFTTAVVTVALGATALFASGANAGSLEPPGWTAGLALGAALPEGAYFIDNASVGGWRGIDDSKSTLGINVPLIAWSTPWTLPGGGRIEVLAAAPEVSGGVPNPGGAANSWSGRDYSELYNPVGFVGAAWDLGGGFGFSAFAGGWAPVDNQLRLFGFDSGAFSERANLSYVANGWKLAANLSFGQAGTSGVHSVFSPTNNQVMPDWFNYDLTATKTIGKWEIGAVGFGSTDTSKGLYTASGGKEQSQFALGGLVGYSFTGITVQTYVTRDVVSDNYYNLSDGSKSYETRLWTRAIIPLWNPPALELYK